ncbi:MAG: hypothetical protein LBE78_02005 [Burkholderiaceae bacterium]|nr:hypothetical protein [Burkholderiaceae bacterium]
MTVRYPLPTLITALALLGVPALAVAADTTAAAAAKKNTAEVKKQSPRKARFVKGPSEESGTERDRRLKRECKGRPNAGACLGYTR